MSDPDDDTSHAGEDPVAPERRQRDAKAWANAASPTPYDPLDRTNLGRSVEAALLNQDRTNLIAVHPFYGAGLYAIYYVGQHELYAPISGTETPIYVGKAVAAGARKGLADAARRSPALWDRVDEHRASIQAARDLDPAEFQARYLVADELFIPMAERLMIRGFTPVWNLVVDGFGNHDPGAKRRDGARPPWDELHPGRWWSTLMPNPSKTPISESKANIARHFAGHPPVTRTGVSPPPTLADEDIPETAIDGDPPAI